MFISAALNVIVALNFSVGPGIVHVGLCYCQQSHTPPGRDGQHPAEHEQQGLFSGAPGQAGDPAAPEIK
jgi:hypothetical protein